MFRKNFRKFIAVLLTASFVFSAAISVYGANFDDEPLQGRQIGRLAVGESSVDEFEGIIFYTTITEDYIYSSQLSPLGYYNFAIRFTDSDQIFTATISMDDLVAVNTYSNLGSLSMLSSAQLSETLHTMVTSNLHAFNLEVIDVIIRHEVFEMPYFADDEPNTDFALAVSPSGAVHPSMASLLSAEFPSYFRRPIFQAVTPGTSWGLPNVTAHTRLLETYSAFRTNLVTAHVFAGWSLAVVSTLLGGWPQLAVRSIAAFILAVTGLLVASTDFILGQHFVAEHWERSVWINNHQRIFARAERERNWSVLSGNLGYQLDRTRVHRDISTGHFHDAIRMMSMGQDVFFREVAFGIILP